MRVNDQEDMFILDALCLSCRLPGGTTWPMTSGACWRPCCPGGGSRAVRPGGAGGSATACWVPEATISKGQRANVPRTYLRRPPADNGADHPLDLADALEDLSPTGLDGLLKQLTKAVLETAPGQMRCGGRCSRDGAPGLIGVACLPARGLGHPEPGGSG